MATKRVGAALTPSEMLDEVELVVRQVREAATASKPAALLGARLRSWARSLASDDLLQSVADRAAVDQVTAQLDEWADMIAPVASVQWDRETLSENAFMLNAFARRGLMSDAEVARWDAIKDEIPSGRAASGPRGPRTPAPDVEGRQCDRFTLLTVNGEVITPKGINGRKPTSAQSAVLAVKNYLKKNGSDPKSLDVKRFIEAVNGVIEGGLPEVTFENAIVVRKSA